MSEFKLPPEEEVEAPQNVKSGIVGNLNFIRFAAEVIDLYVVKAGGSFLGFMSNFETKESEK